jgi:predicted DNA-binding ribbon-helix-helix protein
MKSRVVKRSITISGHRTSVSLEDAFWTALKDIAAFRQMTLSDLVMAVDHARQHNNLSSCLRVFVIDFHRAQSADLPDVQKAPQVGSPSAKAGRLPKAGRPTRRSRGRAASGP